MSSEVNLGKLIEFLCRSDLHNKIRDTELYSDKYESLIIPILRLALEFNWDVEKALELQKYIYEDNLEPEQAKIEYYNPMQLLKEIVINDVVLKPEEFDSVKKILGIESISISFEELDQKAVEDFSQADKKKFNFKFPEP